MEEQQMPRLFGARWWEAVGVTVALVGLAVTLKSVFFSAVPAVLPDDPKYPTVTEQSSCAGHWIITEYQLCEDRAKPLLTMITDPDVCGVTTATELEQTEQFKECRAPSHGIAGYRRTKIFEEWSGWRTGGFDQRSWCNELQARARHKIGQPFAWEVLETREERKEEFLRRFFYKYYCKAEAQWEPIYRNERTEACGAEPPRPVNVEVAMTCPDPSAPVEYERSRREECGATASRTFISGRDISKLISGVRKGEVAWHKCSTCDDLSGNPNEYAECLIASAYYYMESGDTNGMKMIRSRLVARKSNPDGLSSKAERRVIHQLSHLKDAL
jgi:hypothetical protein